MQGIPPYTCSICYLSYNNERIPLILTTCGHTFCKECIDVIITDQEIICPECKQVTLSSDYPIRSLPKNRSLIEMICFHDTKNQSSNDNSKDNLNISNFINSVEFSELTETEKKRVKEIKDNNLNSIKRISLLNEFENTINCFESTYSNITSEHSYINEIKESFLLKEIDEMLNHIIDIVNEYRESLHKKVKSEFEKVDLIKNFKLSINNYRKRIDEYKGLIKRDFINVHASKESGVCCDKKKAEIISINKESKDFIEDIFTNILNDKGEKIINREKNYSMLDDNENKNDVIADNSNKNDKYVNEQCGENENNNDSNNDNNQVKVEKQNITETHNYSFNENTDIIEDRNISNEHIELNNDKINNECKSKLFYIDSLDLTKEEEEKLKSEIEFTKLFNLTLKNYAKEIYNPCVYFFYNKYQADILYDDIRKLLPKICDFDENIFKYNLEEINNSNHNQKKLMKVLSDSCSHSDYKKLKYIFQHFRVNPNFIYSEALDHITYQTSLFGNNNNSDTYSRERDHSSSVINHINLAGSISTTNNTGNTNTNNTINITNNNITQNRGNNDVNSENNWNLESTNINPVSVLNRTSMFSPFNNFRIYNNGSRHYALNSSGATNLKDKIYNMYSYLKLFKDKSELKEFTKYLINEFNYIPFKLEIDSNLDIKLGRDFEWMLNLNTF